MQKRERQLIRGITPLLKKYSKQWFQPVKGKSCTWCDQNLGKNDKHDDYCLYEISKNTLKKWDEIKKSKAWDRKNRSNKDVKNFKDHAKLTFLFRMFLDKRDFIPLDYDDPCNKRVVCTCYWYFSNRPEVFKNKRHHKDCPINKVAGLLSKLYSN